MFSGSSAAAAAFPGRDSQPYWQFRPDDAALIVDYLQKKVNNEPIREEIIDVDLRQEDPEALIRKHPKLGGKEWYFFSPRDRKYRNGKRPNRGCKTGYWKATGKDIHIYFEEKLVGFWRKLVFYRGEARKGEKTNLMMKEYRINRPPRDKENPDDMRLDDWVLCIIYEQARKARDPSCSKPRNKKRKRDNNDVEAEAAVGMRTEEPSVPEVMNDRHHLQSLGNGSQNQCPYNPYFQPSFISNGGDGGQQQLDPGGCYLQSGSQPLHRPQDCVNGLQGPDQYSVSRVFPTHGGYGGHPPYNPAPCYDEQHHLHHDQSLQQYFPEQQQHQSFQQQHQSFQQQHHHHLQHDHDQSLQHFPEQQQHQSFQQQHQSFQQQHHHHLQHDHDQSLQHFPEQQQHQSFQQQHHHHLHHDQQQHHHQSFQQRYLPSLQHLPVPAIPAIPEQHLPIPAIPEQHLPIPAIPEQHPSLQHLPVPAIPAIPEQHHRDSIFNCQIEEPPLRSLERDVGDELTKNNRINQSAATNNIADSPDDSSVTFNPYHNQ